MQQAMAPPEGYGSRDRVSYESYRQEQAPQNPSRRPRPESVYNTPNRQIGYREDYSRAQHASLDQEQKPGITRASSDVGPAVSQEHLRFSAHVNRFASHDPRTTPVHSNRGVSVSERIKRFNAGTPEPQNMRQQPPSPQRFQETRYYPKSPHPQRGGEPHQSRSSQRAQHFELQEQAPDLSQDHYLSEQQQQQRHLQQQAPKAPTRAQRALSRERERRSRSPAAQTTEQALGPSHSSEQVEQDRRSRSPTARRSASNQASPSRAMETQRAARSLLAKRRQRRLEQEAKQSGNQPSQQSDHDRNQGNNGNETIGNEGRDAEMKAAEQQEEVKKVAPRRDDSRTDRILREARSRSMSPRVSRYSRKAYGAPAPSPTLYNGTPEKPARYTDYRGGTEERRTRNSVEHQSAPITPGGRGMNNQSTAHVAWREQEPVSPMTPGSPQVPGSPASRSSPQRNSGVRKDSGEESVNTSGSASSSVKELKRQLWDNNETLQVAVKPSLRAHGYSDRRTKQTLGYYAPEMAGHQGQRVRSLSPNPRHEVHGHERPASSIGAPSSSAVFNSKFVQAAISSREGEPTQHHSVESLRTASSSPHPTSAERRRSHHHDDQPRRRSQSPQLRSRSPAPIERRRSSYHHDTDQAPRRSQSPQLKSSDPTSTEHRRSYHHEEQAHHRSQSPQLKSSGPTSTEHRHPHHHKEQARLRADSPRPQPVTPLKTESLRSLPSEGGNGQRAGSSIERVPSSAGASAATGEASASVSKLVAKLSSVSRDDPEKALRMIDTILRAESKGSSGGPGSRAGSRTGSQAEVKFPISTPLNEEVATAEEDDESESSETSCDDTSISSITNPTYQRDDKAHAHALSLSSSRTPRPSSLNKYAQLQPSPSQEESRGKSNKTKKEKKPPPPTTIKVNKSDSGGSRSSDKNSSSKKDESRESSTARKVNKLTPSSRDRKERAVSKAMDPAAIAMKIKGWDEQADFHEFDTAQLSPSKTEDTTGTDELGSIITPKSEKQLSENRRAHPWDDSHPQTTSKPRAIDLTIGTETGTSIDAFGAEGADAFGPVSPWQRRRVAKQEADGSNAISSGAVSAEGKTNDRRHSGSRSGTPTRESPRIAPNVYDIHRNRRNRSRSRERRDKSRSLLDEKLARDAKLARDTRAVNPFDADYNTTGTSKSTTRSDTRNPFDSGYKKVPSSTKSEVANPFDSDFKRRPSGSKSDTGNVFDSAWGALPTDVFSSQSASRGRSRPSTPLDETDAFGMSSTGVNLPPRTPTNRAPFGREEAPEASRDASENGGKKRRSFLKMKRGSTPKKDRQPQQPRGSKPLLSAHAMDSDEVTDIRDEFKLKPRERSSRSPGAGRRSRTLSPSPRSLMKSKSPGRNRLSRSRNNSFVEAEDESSSLTGSLTGSTTSSVRNKNLAKKFSRFLKVYED